MAVCDGRPPRPNPEPWPEGRVPTNNLERLIASAPRPPVKPAEAFAATPKPSMALHDLAAEYYKRTEAYDRTVCTGPMGQDGILPANRHELGLINRNAIAVWRELMPRVIEAGFTERDFRRAVGNYRP